MRVLLILESTNELVLCSEYTNVLIFYDHVNQKVSKEFELRDRPRCAMIDNEQIYLGHGSGIEVVSTSNGELIREIKT